MSGYIKDRAHYFPLRVYFSDTDAGGIVYHSRYIDMAEHARTEMLRCMGLTHQEYLDKDGTCFVVRGMKIDYNKPAKMDELLTVRTTAVKLTRFALDLLQEVCLDGEVLVSMEIRLGYISLAVGRPSPIPEAWKEPLGRVLA